MPSEEREKGAMMEAHRHTYQDWSWCQHGISNETPLKSYCSLNTVTLRFILVVNGQVKNKVNQQHCANARDKDMEIEMQIFYIQSFTFKRT